MSRCRRDRFHPAVAWLIIAGIVAAPAGLAAIRAAAGM
jgi:hypothetical protein